jgi:NTE family protein
MRNTTSAWMTSVWGQPGFFTPRFPGPFGAAPGAKDATSYYDTAPLRQTLLDLVDFRRLNDKEKLRFSVGAVNIATGNFTYFDNKTEKIEPEHIMASGALPPALPMVKIGTDYFWDGGIVSNTPLQHLLDQEDGLNALVFQVDLFSARGPLPRDIQEVMSRQKDIVYSSRTRMVTDVFAERHKWKKLLHEALVRVPDAKLTDDEKQMRAQLSDLPEITILQLIYQQKVYEGPSKDYEFSPGSMREHWQSGLEDTLRTLKQKKWLTIPPDGAGVVTHDVHADRV